MNWIIGIGGSDLDGVDVLRVYGTKPQVKKYLLELAKDERCSEDYDFGTETINEILERDNGSLYAFNCFYDHHTDYEATPENNHEMIVL